MHELRNRDHRNRRILIAGGGNIGGVLAARIEQDYTVRLIEQRRARAQELAERLRTCLVLHGDATNSELLRQENIANTDVFCALTNDDEANIMSSLLAKRLGARKVITLITKPEYVSLMESRAIDIAISPQQITMGALLTHIRRGDLATVHSLRRGAAEALEIIVHGDRNTSRVVGRRVGEIQLPPGATFGAVVRSDEVLIADPGTTIETNDHVILFLTDKKQIPKVENLFQVGFNFF